MRKQKYTGRQTIRKMSKCRGPTILCDDISIAFAERIEDDVDIMGFRCQVPLKDPEYILRGQWRTETAYASDFVLYFTDGHVGVRECVSRWDFSKTRFQNLLQMSKAYWRACGITDWAVVTDKEDFL